MQGRAGLVWVKEVVEFHEFRQYVIQAVNPYNTKSPVVEVEVVVVFLSYVYLLFTFTISTEPC